MAVLHVVMSAWTWLRCLIIVCFCSPHSEHKSPEPPDLGRKKNHDENGEKESGG